MQLERHSSRHTGAGAGRPELVIGGTITSVAVFQIDDPGDPRIADYRNIPDPALLERRQVFVAEGRHVVRRLLGSKRLVTRSLMLTPAAFSALGLADGLPAAPVFLVPQTVMNTVTGFNIHRGCLAIGERGTPLDWQTLAAGARRLVILERVANADNVGAIFRNAAAFGVDAVLLGPDCTDPLYRKAIRTSMAATLTVPFAYLETPGGATDARAATWLDAVRLLRADGVHVIALSPRADATPLRTVAWPDRVALLAGHEGDGLTREAMDVAATVARIPMAPGHDSLNIATAVGIALHELFTIHDS